MVPNRLHCLKHSLRSFRWDGFALPPIRPVGAFSARVEVLTRPGDLDALESILKRKRRSWAE